MDANDLPVNHLVQGLRQSKLVRFYEQLDARFSPIHLKELAVPVADPSRQEREQIVNARSRARLREVGRLHRDKNSHALPRAPGVNLATTAALEWFRTA